MKVVHHVHCRHCIIICFMTLTSGSFTHQKVSPGHLQFETYLNNRFNNKGQQKRNRNPKPRSFSALHIHLLHFSLFIQIVQQWVRGSLATLASHLYFGWRWIFVWNRMKLLLCAANIYIHLCHVSFEWHQMKKV